MWLCKDILAFILMVEVSYSFEFSESLSDSDIENNYDYTIFKEPYSDDESNRNFKDHTGSLNTTSENVLDDSNGNRYSLRASKHNQNRFLDNNKPEKRSYFRTLKESKLLNDSGDIKYLSTYRARSHPRSTNHFSKFTKTRAHPKESYPLVAEGLFEDNGNPNRPYNDDEKYFLHNVVKDTYPSLDDTEVSELVELITSNNLTELRTNEDDKKIISINGENQKTHTSIQDKSDLLNLYSLKTFSIPISKTHDVSNKKSGLLTDLENQGVIQSNNLDGKSELQSLANSFDTNYGAYSHLATVLSKIIDDNYTVYNTTHLIWYDIDMIPVNSTLVPITDLFNKNITVSHKETTFPEEDNLEWYNIKKSIDPNNYNIPLQDFEEPVSTVINDTYITSVHTPADVKNKISAKQTTIPYVVKHLYQNPSFENVNPEHYELVSVQQPITTVKEIIKHKIEDKPLIKYQLGRDYETTNSGETDSQKMIMVYQDSSERSEKYAVETDPLLKAYASKVSSEKPQFKPKYTVDITKNAVKEHQKNIKVKDGKKAEMNVRYSDKFTVVKPPTPISYDTQFEKENSLKRPNATSKNLVKYLKNIPALPTQSEMLLEKHRQNVEFGYPISKESTFKKVKGLNDLETLNAGPQPTVGGKDSQDECGDGTVWVRNCHSCYCSNGKPFCDKINDCVLRAFGEPMICKPYSKFVIDDCFACECNADGIPECKAHCNTEVNNANRLEPKYQDFYEAKQAQAITNYYKEYNKMPRACNKNIPTCESGTSWTSSCHQCFCLDGKHVCEIVAECSLDEKSHGQPSRCKPNTKFYPKTNNLPCTTSCTCDDEGSPNCVQ